MSPAKWCPGSTCDNKLCLCLCAYHRQSSWGAERVEGFWRAKDCCQDPGFGRPLKRAIHLVADADTVKFDFHLSQEIELENDNFGTYAFPGYVAHVIFIETWGNRPVSWGFGQDGRNFARIRSRSPRSVCESCDICFSFMPVGYIQFGMCPQIQPNSVPIQPEFGECKGFLIDICQCGFEQRHAKAQNHHESSEVADKEERQKAGDQGHFQVQKERPGVVCFCLAVAYRRLETLGHG